MQLSDLLPTSEQLIGIQGVEKSLLQRRRNGTRLSALLALLGAVLQVVLIVAKAIPIPNSFTWQATKQFLVSPESAAIGFFLAAALVYLTIRYTGFLFKESKEPFRYTFDIQPFTRIDATPAERYSLPQEDFLNLLHVDLMERLNRRIKRLSLLEDPSKATAGEPSEHSASSTHIHIEGKYAIRQDKAGGWVLQVLPEIRIGSESNPSTLGYSIRHSLAAQEIALSVSQFEQLTERVYSSIATEIYRQIKNDVENKITMFPTDYLQAVARYCEARDFENSNTIDSYDRALELYRTSIHAFDVSATGSLVVRLTSHDWFRGWRWVRPALQAEARARLGYARCMVYRRIVSELAGRNQNPLFEIRKELKEARELVTRCYNSLMPSENLRFLLNGDANTPSAEQISLNGILEFPNDRAFRARRADAYRLLREELCETYAVSALGYSQLTDTGSAQKFLKISESLQPGKDANRALILLAKSFVDGDLRQRIAYLRQAKELAPDSEIINYRLAILLDMLGRSLNEISRDRIETIRREYQSVLKINPGNVSCLIGQGYLSWLVEDLDTAENAYSVADDLKDMVSQTFVGDLKYGLARVAAERAAQAVYRATTSTLAGPETSTPLLEAAAKVELARRSYAEAVAADPAVAACYDASARVKNGYFGYICDAMLERYRQFSQKLVAAMESGKRISCTGNTAWFSTDSWEIVQSYALNDYGAACFNYYLRFELRWNNQGPRKRLQESILALEQATGGSRPNTPVPAQYNLAIAYGWRNDPLDSNRQLRLLKDVLRAFPNWLEAVRTNSLSRISHGLDLLGHEREKLADLERKNQEERALEQRRNKETATRQPMPESPEKGSQQTLVNTSPDAPTRKLGPEAVPADDIRGNPDEPSKQVKNAQRHIGMIQKRLAKELGRARDRIFHNTLLESIKDESALTLRRLHWDRLGDSEAFALGAWAELQGRIPAIESEAIYQNCGATLHAPLDNLIVLCKLLLTNFYAEDYVLLQTLISALRRQSDPQEMHAKDVDVYAEVLKKVFDREQKFDPNSRLIRYISNAYRSYDAERDYAKGVEQFQKDEFEKAVSFYLSASANCPSNDFYHSELSLTFERWERQLLDRKSNSSSQETPDSLRAKAFSEIQRAAELDPDNIGYRERRVTLRMRQWVVDHGFEQALDAYPFCDRMKIEVSESIVNQLVNPKDNTLKAGLQNKISELREKINLEAGVVLPGVRFTDNQSFAKGECRFLIRDVPSGDSACVSADDTEIWESIVEGLENASWRYAAEYFGPQDLIGAINKLRQPQAAFMRLLDTPGTLGAATIILKGLLREQVSIANLAAILPVIQTETAAGAQVLAIQEHIRSLPEIRNLLPGNSPKTPLHILRLNDRLEGEIYRSIGKNWGASTLNAELSDIERWLGQLQIPLNDAGGKTAVGILTDADVRPFLSELTQVSFPGVPVLSDQEILTPLLVAVAGEMP